METLDSEMQRRAVLAELARRGWTHNRLADDPRHGVDRNCVHRWLSGKVDPGASRVSLLMSFLDLQITPKKYQRVRRAIGKRRR